MTPQMKQLDKAINTPEMFDLVNAYFLQRAYAEITREQVDAIYAAILQEIPLYVRLDWQERHEMERITTNNDMYLSDDDETAKRIYAEADKRERAAGIKPAEMPAEYCPALVAECDLRDIEHQIVNVSGAVMGISVDRLLCSAHGVDNLHKWRDLVVGAVVRLSNFKPVTLEQQAAQ